MEAGDASRLKAPEAENAKLRRIVAERMLDMSAMKELLENHWRAYGDAQSLRLSDAELRLSERRSCRLVGLARPVQQHRRYRGRLLHFRSPSFHDPGRQLCARKKRVQIVGCQHSHGRSHLFGG